MRSGLTRRQFHQCATFLAEVLGLGAKLTRVAWFAATAGTITQSNTTPGRCVFPGACVTPLFFWRLESRRAGLTDAGWDGSLQPACNKGFVLAKAAVRPQSFMGKYPWQIPQLGNSALARPTKLGRFDRTHHICRRPPVAAPNPHDLSFAIDERSRKAVINRAGFPFYQDRKTTR